MFKKLARAGLILILSTFCDAVYSTSPPSVNIAYTGNLVAEPCTLLPKDENIKLDFGSVIDKYLYLNTRTNSKPFELHLMDCDTSLGEILKITFRGIESVELPGMLALDSSSEASGVVIGLETPDGKAMPLNQLSRGHQIINGDNVILLQAYVKGEPMAITERKINKGSFTAVATFSLEYE